jgi:hypothetical protein
MALTKQIIVDKIETTKSGPNHYHIGVRETTQILEDGDVISSKHIRYVLAPDHDVSTISDPVVLAQFNAVMTQEVKDNYQTFLASKKTK